MASDADADDLTAGTEVERTDLGIDKAHTLGAWGEAARAA